MLIRPDVVFNALKTLCPSDISFKKGNSKTKIIMMSARGKKFDQAKAEELAKLDQIVILAGHYEGFDQRISDYMIDEEISVGEYVLNWRRIAGHDNNRCSNQIITRSIRKRYF